MTLSFIIIFLRIVRDFQWKTSHMCQLNYALSLLVYSHSFFFNFLVPFYINFHQYSVISYILSSLLIPEKFHPLLCVKYHVCGDDSEIFTSSPAHFPESQTQTLNYQLHFLIHISSDHQNLSPNLNSSPNHPFPSH